MGQCALYKRQTKATKLNHHVKSEGPIIPILIGDADKAVDISKILVWKRYSHPLPLGLQPFHLTPVV